MKERLLNIKKSLDLASSLMTDYCQTYGDFVGKVQGIEDMNNTILSFLKELERLLKEQTTNDYK